MIRELKEGKKDCANCICQIGVLFNFPKGEEKWSEEKIFDGIQKKEAAEVIMFSFPDAARRRRKMGGETHFVGEGREWVPVLFSTRPTQPRKVKQCNRDLEMLNSILSFTQERLSKGEKWIEDTWIDSRLLAFQRRNKHGRKRKRKGMTWNTATGMSVWCSLQERGSQGGRKKVIRCDVTYHYCSLSALSPQQRRN